MTPQFENDDCNRTELKFAKRKGTHNGGVFRAFKEKTINKKLRGKRGVLRNYPADYQRKLSCTKCGKWATMEVYQ